MLKIILCIIIYVCRQTCLQAFKYSGIQVGMFSYNYVGMCAFLPASRQAVTQSSLQEYAQGQQVLQQSSITKKKNIFPKETEKRKKEKESNLTGPGDADRPKGIGISPEGCLVRNEQGIMPKSFCQTAKARHTFGFFLLFLLIKI